MVAWSVLGLRVRTPSGTWMPVSCECCVLSVRGLCEWGQSLVQRSPTECVCVFVSGSVIWCNNNPLPLHNEYVEVVRLRKKERKTEKLRQKNL